MASVKNQEALDFLIGYPRVIIKGRGVSVEKLTEAYTTLQEAINELEEYKKYIPNLEEFYKWCKGEYLQIEGMNLKSQALKESEKQ